MESKQRFSAALFEDLGSLLTAENSPPESEPGRDDATARLPQLALRARGLTKQFTGIRVLDSVDLDLVRGEVHALLGENGSGKSTMVKIIAGVYRPDGGSLIDEVGNPLPAGVPAEGAAFIHQELGLVGSMTVAENIALAAGYPERRGLIDWHELTAEARRVLDLVGLAVDPARRLHTLTPAEQSLVAIGRALAVNPQVLVLDEPTATLSEDDVARLFVALERLRAQNLAILYVSHRLDEIFRIANRVTVLRDGKRVFTRPITGLSSAELVEAITGQLPREIPSIKRSRGRRQVLRVVDLQVGNVGPVSFQIDEGEVFALVGLRGAGQDLVGRAIFGDTKVERGSVAFNGTPLSVRSIRDATRRGIGLVPRDRRAEGLAAGMTVRENIFLNPRRSGRAYAWVGTRAERRRARSLIERHDVRPDDTERLVDVLSGGNQQKVVLARWMSNQGSLLILEDPTSGVDVGAKAEIYALVGEMLTESVSVLLISTDVEEVQRIAHRALILRNGRSVIELEREQISIGALTAAATGADAADQLQA